MIIHVLMICAILPAIVALIIVVPNLYGRVSRIHLARRCRRVGAVVLTYDDGPGTLITPKLILLTRSYAVKVTFFCLGMRAEENSEIMDVLKMEGHEIACHGFRHSHPWKVMPSEALHDIIEGYDSLSRWLSPDRWYRPPYGKLTLYTWVLLFFRRSRPIWWTHDSGDAWTNGRPAVDAFVQDVLRSGGGVVLLHDFDRSGKLESDLKCDFVLSVTRQLIEKSALAGLKIMTLRDLFNSK